MKKVLLILAFMAMTFTSSAQKIHFICFADTDDATIGKGVSKSLNNMLDFVMTLSEKVDMEDDLMPSVVMMGDDCNSRNLVSVIRNFRCDSKDIVIFCYLGHGVRGVNDGSDFPQICLGSKNVSDFISLEYVKDALVSKGPRLCLVLGDCCNNYHSMAVAPQENVLVAASPVIGYGGSAKGLKKLFLDSTGSIIASASKRGEYAWVNKSGGFFTNAFLHEMNVYTHATQSSCTWEGLLLRTRDRVVDVSTKALKDKGEYVQTPIYRIERHAKPYEAPEPPPAPKITPVRIEQGVRTALMTLADTSLPPGHRVVHYESILKTFFASGQAMVDLVACDMQTLVDYSPASDYLLKLATINDMLTDVRVVEEVKDSDGRLKYLKVQEIY